jgi:CDP-glucose 4,6-dehydratase
MLLSVGANVTGYSLEPPTQPGLYDICGLDGEIDSVTGDVRDFEKLSEVFARTKPEIVFHLAAQPIVREGYKNPRLTYETNVMGTVNLLECCANSDSVRSVVNVTTDKVYRNNEWDWGYRENDLLDGFDPYSNSKSCSELVTQTYIRSFFADGKKSVSTARAGNVIGGGDFAADRIIPDCIRAAQSGGKIILRNPHSVRPYQFVIEPLYAYMLIAKLQYENPSVSGSYNVGPNENGYVSTGGLADIFCEKWGGISWECVGEKNAPHEAGILKLDCSKIKCRLDWKPLMNVEEAVGEVVELTKAYLNGESVSQVMDRQITQYFERIN